MVSFIIIFNVVCGFIVLIIGNCKRVKVAAVMCDINFSVKIPKLKGGGTYCCYEEV